LIIKSKKSTDHYQLSTGVRFLFLSVSFLHLIFFLWNSDRDNVIDNQNYLDYFSTSGLEKLADFWDGIKKGDVKSFVSVFTEELLWWCWIVLLSGLDPLTAVRLTTVCISIFIFAACLTYRNSFLGWLLWLLQPAAFSVVGYFQIRQGFALSFFLGFGAVFGRYGLGLVFAALIHTTFLIPLILYSVSRAFNLPQQARAIIVLFAAVILPIILAKAFDEFGGRRFEQYSASEGASSLGFVIANCLLLSLPMFLLFTKKLKGMFPSHMVDYIINYSGFLVFLVSSFFIFPLATSRTSYYTWLFAIPIIASLDYKFAMRMNFTGLLLFSILSIHFVLLMYTIVKLFFVGKYFCFDLACAYL